jgi:hypothetical protein
MSHNGFAPRPACGTKVGKKIKASFKLQSQAAVLPNEKDVAFRLFSRSPKLPTLRYYADEPRVFNQVQSTLSQKCRLVSSFCNMAEPQAHPWCSFQDDLSCNTGTVTLPSCNVTGEKKMQRAKEVRKTKRTEGEKRRERICKPLASIAYDVYFITIFHFRPRGSK